MAPTNAMRRIKSLSDLDMISAYTTIGVECSSLVLPFSSVIIDPAERAKKERTASRTRSESVDRGAARLHHIDFFTSGAAQDVEATPEYKEIAQVLGKAPGLWVRYIFTITVSLGQAEKMQASTKNKKSTSHRLPPKQKINLKQKRKNLQPPTLEELARRTTACTSLEPLLEELGFDHIYVMVGDAYVVDGKPLIDFFGAMFDLSWTWQVVGGHFMQTMVGWTKWESGRSQKPVYTGKKTTKTDEEIWTMCEEWCKQNPTFQYAANGANCSTFANHLLSML